MTVFCFGFGYVAHALAPLMSVPVCGTQRSPADQGCLFAYHGDGVLSDAAHDALAQADTILISIPPDAQGCPVVRHADVLLAQTPKLKRIQYLSTTSVYGDRSGQWVDETATLQPTSDRAHHRILAERQWQDWGASRNQAVQIFRLSGIYGVGRSPFERIAQGDGKIIDAPGQVFNRIHVDDIAQTLKAGMQHDESGIFNLSDDVPSAQADVLRYAYTLLGQEPPVSTPLDQAILSPMAQDFYRDCKRVCNEKIKQELGITLLYPSYIDGLNAIYRARDTQPSA